jgi:hypothetical protein
MSGEPRRTGFPGGANGQEGRSHGALIGLPASVPFLPRQLAEQLLGSLSHRPELLDGEVNVVRLRPIDETIAGFPAHYRYGWGQLQMGLDRVSRRSVAGREGRDRGLRRGHDTPLLRHPSRSRSHEPG